jgi:hypothetical protein
MTTNPTFKLLDRTVASFILLALVVLLPIAAWFLPPIASWIASAFLLLIFMLTLGLAITGRVSGILINEQNVFSLARLQAVVWTIIILSAYIVSVTVRIRHCADAPLDIGIDQNLWAVMGISVTSLIGSPLIAATKYSKNPDPTETVKTAKALVATGNTPATQTDATTSTTPAAELKSQQVQDTIDTIHQSRQGTLYANPTLADATFSDLFEGDEIGNAAQIDLGKLQMFFFTVVIALAYCLSLASTFWTIKDGDSNPISQFPVLSQGMLALLGISHAGFLLNKGVDHTKQPDGSMITAKQ